MSRFLQLLNQEIIRCEACPRLRKYCGKIAQVKRRAYADEEYWGKPITGFGQESGRLMIIGLAPGAHGANRTGRIFTGDRSGEWLYRALHKSGFANQPTSAHRDDGLKLNDAYISCIVKCAPPGNKPTPKEVARCSTFLERELELLKNVQVFLALGQIAFQGIWPWIGSGKTRPKFQHGETIPLDSKRTLILSYHPSQQNTFTGRLTEKMFDGVFEKVRKEIPRAIL